MPLRYKTFGHVSYFKCKPMLSNKEVIQIVKLIVLSYNFCFADLRRCDQRDVQERRDGDYFEIQVLLLFSILFSIFVLWFNDG